LAAVIDTVTTLQEIISTNQQAAYWFNLLPDLEKRMLSPVLNQVLATTQYYNGIFPGFTVWITGSSLNLVERSHNDIDVMVVVPVEVIRKAKQETLSSMWRLYKEQDISTLMELGKDPRTTALGITEVLGMATDSLRYSMEIRGKNTEALSKRVTSPQEVNRILLDAPQELEAARVKVDGMIEMEKNEAPTEADGTQGYQFGPLVLAFLRHVETGVARVKNQEGQPVLTVDWRKSFSEGYEAGAGDNNCYLYNSNVQAAPVHLFLVTEVNSQKAMEKKESFMLEYYTPQERLAPVRLV